MDPRFTTYCDLPFLERFYRAKPTGDPALFDESDVLWLDVHRFLVREADVVLDASADELKALLQHRPFLKYFFDKPAGTEFRLDPTAFENLEAPASHHGTGSPWRLYLIEETGSPHEELSASLGTLFLQASDATAAWRRIGRPALLDVSIGPSKQSMRAWKELRQFAAPLTALVLCDRYVLKHGKRLEENAGGLLLSLLPEGPNDVSVDVMVITEQVGGPDLPRLHRRLEDYIRTQRPQLVFSLSIVSAPTSAPETHDRHVFMNYGLLKSGQSFNYFKEGEVDTSTTLDFTPIVDRHNLRTAVAKLQELARLVERTRGKIGLYPQIAGGKSNRLLDAVREGKS